MAGSIGRRVFGVAFGTALLAGLPFGLDLGLKPFPASKIAKHYTIIYNHCTVCTTSLANLWQVEFLQGEWEHSKRGIGTGNIRHASHASHVGHVFHVMIFDASFRDGKNA